MKKFNSFKVAATGVMGSVTIAVALAIYSQYYRAQTRTVGIPPNQQAGEVSKNENALKGGVLQRNLMDEKPQEYLIVGTSTTAPRYTADELTVHAGNVVSVTLQNQSSVNHAHSWVLIQPGTTERVLAAAETTEQEWDWIPDSADILAFVPLTQPGQSTTRMFRAPAQPGDYPFLCTFPGHGREMHGTLHVLEK